MDIARLYFAFRGSETVDEADAYFAHVTSTSSLLKTSVYLAETIVSDLFIVRIQVLFLNALRTDRVAPPAISVLYCMECEHSYHRYPSHFICRRHRYASPSSIILIYTELNAVFPL